MKSLKNSCGFIQWILIRWLNHWIYEILKGQKETLTVQSVLLYISSADRSVVFLMLAYMYVALSLINQIRNKSVLNFVIY